jgi:hypothetical protein
MPSFKPASVVDVKDFRAFQHMLAVECVIQAAVRQDAVAIQQQEFDLSGAGDNLV